MEIDELSDELGPRPSDSGTRASDKGFLNMSTAAYIELLDWTARQLAPGKHGATPENSPPILERLKIEPNVWCELVSNFGQLFNLVAGRPQHVDAHRSRTQRQFPMRQAARELLPA